jgi:hypothetical protein
MNGASCGYVDQYDFSKELLLTVLLETNAEFHSILGIEGCQKICHWMNMKVIPLEDYTSFQRKKYLCAFDDYMDNVVEGMNLAAKHSDMSAKPKDNMSTTADSMQSHSNLKSKSCRCDLGYNLNNVPLYYICASRLVWPQSRIHCKAEEDCKSHDHSRVPRYVIQNIVTWYSLKLSSHIVTFQRK